MLLKCVHWSSATFVTDKRREANGKQVIINNKKIGKNMMMKFYLAIGNAFTHIVQIILEILILSPDDAHGWVRALSSKRALLKRGRKTGEGNRTISNYNVLFFELVGYVFNALDSCWAEPDIKTD